MKASASVFFSAQAARAFHALGVAFDEHRFSLSPSPTLECPGLIATSAVPEGSPVIVIPVASCLSPQTVAWSPLGPLLSDALGGSDGIRVRCSEAPMPVSLHRVEGGGNPSERQNHDPLIRGELHLDASSCLVTCACAFHCRDEQSPFFEYLHHVARVDYDVKKLHDALMVQAGPRAAAEFLTLRAALSSAMTSLSVLLSKVHSIGKCQRSSAAQERPDAAMLIRRQLAQLTPDELLRAHMLCESRSMSLADLDAVGLEGPLIIPGFDLINHSDKVPNIAVRLAFFPSEVDDSAAESSDDSRSTESMLCAAQRTTTMTGLDTLLHNRSPSIVVCTAREVAPGNELHYQYLGDDSRMDPVMWASRYHFMPPRLTTFGS